MKIVLDNNVLFQIMNPFSTASYLFFSINVEFFTPEFIKKEFNKHKEECLVKSSLSEQEFEVRQDEIEKSIRFIPSFEYEEFLEESFQLISDSEDIDFLAIALSINAPIWSNDPHLKEQSLIKIYSTKNIVEMFLKREI